MDRLQHVVSRVLAVVLGLSAGAAFAGYAQAVPPSGWSAAAAGATERGAYRAAANEAWTGGTIITRAAINMGGRAVTMPAALRFAANAGRFAGGFAFSNPLIIGAAIAAPLIYDWFQQNGGFSWNATSQQWEKSSVVGVFRTGGAANTDASTMEGSCHIFRLENRAGSGYPLDAVFNGQCYMGFAPLTTSNFREAVNIQQVSTQTVKSPATQQDMEDGMEGKPVPDTVANGWPSAWPVEDPTLNPDGAGNPQPYRVPNGSPQPVPNTNPQRYKQPVIDAVPTPVPWQVDLQPKDIESEDPAGQAEPATPPASAPAGQTATPKDTPDLCAEHPDALACQTLDQPSDVDLPTRAPSITITPDSGWGADNAACPAARHLTVQGHDIPIPYDLFCTFMSGIRPVVIAVGWLIAALMVVGAVRGGE